MNRPSFYAQVYEMVRRIPPGRVMSYGQIAALLGVIHGARAVGGAMRAAPDGLPCHRVVKNDGEPGCIPGFAELLRAEGVQLSDGGRIDMRRFRWKP